MAVAFGWLSHWPSIVQPGRSERELDDMSCDEMRWNECICINIKRRGLVSREGKSCM